MLPQTLVFWPVFEVSNVYIILTWFTTDRPTHPWTLPQTMALIRAVALAGMLYVIYSHSKEGGSLTARGLGQLVKKLLRA
jgi:hypothetical protein